MMRENQINFSEGPHGKENNHPDYELIREKFNISRFATGERLGSQNAYQAAINLYAALYDQKKIDGLIDPSEKFPERMDIMRAPLSHVPSEIPDQEKFIAEFRRVLTREVDYGEAVSEATKAQLFEIMKKCEKTFIWTDGDTEGVPEQGLPGSREQLYKIGSAQFYNQMRQEIARERGVERSDVLSIVSAEGKMKRIPDIINKFLELGVEQMIVIEDKVKNLEAVRQIIAEKSKLEVFLIWIRHGEYGVEDVNDQQKDILVVKNFADISKVSEGLGILDGEKKLGAIIDLDGTISDDDKRKELQIVALMKSFQEKGWI